MNEFNSMDNAKYTCFLKTIMTNPSTSPKLEKALSTYPIYIQKSKEQYKPVFIPTREELNKAILDYYKYREIGFETIGRFLEELEITMNEIMPYYNELMFTADQDFDILFNVDYTKTIETERAGRTSAQSNDESTGTNKTTASDTSSTESTMTGTGKTINSETPQNELQITALNMDSVPYADKVQWDKNGTDSNASTTGTNTANSETSSSGSNTSSGETEDSESTIENTRGNFGVVSSHELIAKYRDIIINIKQKIIKDKRLSELFMMIY